MPRGAGRAAEGREVASVQRWEDTGESPTQTSRGHSKSEARR